jgi:hypothetical protein
MRRIVAGVVCAGLVAARAEAHVAPAVDVDNRYVKLTLLGDRVRLAYTVYFGQLPGAVQRRAMDTDQDGALSPAESDAFGQAIGARVREAIAVTVDGAAAATTWDLVDVGLGTPSVRAGAFSVDLVAWYCAPGGARTVALVDRYALPRPGETEVRIEAGPGVRVEKATLGALPLTDLGLDGADARWEGPGGPLAEGGLSVRFVAGPDAPRSNDGACRRAVSGTPWIVWPAAGALLVAGAAAWALRRRVRAQRKMNG